MNEFPRKPDPAETTPRVAIHDIFQMTEKEMERLRTRISENQGLVRLMVHPYFYQREKPEGYKTRAGMPNQRIDIVEQGFHRLLARSPENSPPVFLFEEHEQIAATSEKILEILQQSGNDIYIVPTHSGFGIPYFENLSPFNRRCWERLIGIFKDLGIKKCLVSGMYLWRGEVSPTKPIPNDNILGCVGRVANELRRDFKIVLSTLTYPLKRGELAKPDTEPK